jgi:hypothetical protein
VKSYDAIILYVYLLEIMCIRQSRIYIAEENVNQLNLEYSLTLDQYYSIIIDNINININNSNSNVIPQSFLWDTNKLTNIKYIEHRKEINDKSSIIYRSRIKSISESRNELVSSCEQISKIITPNISKQGFVQECENIILDRASMTKQYNPKSTYWLQKTINNYDIKLTNDFIYNMNKVVKDAWYDRIIEDIDSNSYLEWIVYNNNAKTLLDSLYKTISSGLNLQLDLIGAETTNPYTEVINEKRQFTEKTLKTLVEDNNYGSDISKIQNVFWILQKTLKIKFIIFEMFPKETDTLDIGDLVLFRGRPIRVTNISKNASNNIVYTLYDGYNEYNNVLSTDIQYYTSNLLNNFRLFCGYKLHEETEEYNDYLYLVLVNENGNFLLKLVQQTNNNFIVNTNSIPIFIKYFLFNSCSDIINKVNQTGFKKFMPELLHFLEERKQRIQESNIVQDINKIEENLKQYRKQYKAVKNIKNKTLEQQAEKVLLKEEIKELKDRLSSLQKIINGPNMSGGNIEQYYQGQPQIQGQMNANPIIINYAPPMPYYSQKRLPYNVSLNKAKDQQSKLSFYTNVELELFPGTSVNPLQRGLVKCQNTFERIREAWADIFGYQYRPAPMTEAYQYQTAKKPDAKDDTKLETKKIE